MNRPNDSRFHGRTPMPSRGRGPLGRGPPGRGSHQPPMRGSSHMGRFHQRGGFGGISPLIGGRGPPPLGGAPMLQHPAGRPMMGNTHHRTQPPPPPPPPPPVMGQQPPYNQQHQRAIPPPPPPPPPPLTMRRSGPPPPPPPPPPRGMGGRLPSQAPMRQQLPNQHAFSPGHGPYANNLHPGRQTMSVPAGPRMPSSFVGPQLNGSAILANPHTTTLPPAPLNLPFAHKSASASTPMTRPNQTNFSMQPPTSSGQSTIRTSNPSTETPTYTKQQTDQAWSEHTSPSGVKYYYNSITRESTYTKPDALRERETPVAAQGVDIGSPWVEYTDPTTKKTYYSNGKSTTWEKPKDYQENTTDTTHDSEASEPHKKKRKATKKEIHFGSREEAIAAFKGLLLAKDIAPALKWNEVVKICSSDPRWDGCEDVLTTGERKQALAEYQTKRANELRSVERQERARARDSFIELLTNVLPTLSDFSGWNSRFSDVRDTLAKDDRFHTVADDATRESLFLDFCEEYRKREERKKRSKKREALDGFNSFLKEKEELGSLTFASTWNSFLSVLSEEDRVDPRFQVSSALSDDDRQLCFADFVISLQAMEDDKRRRIQAARRRAEKAQRDAYLEALRNLASEGSILPSSRWRIVEDIVSSDPNYKLVKEQDRDAPRDIFEGFVEQWSESYRRDRSLLSRLAKPQAKDGLRVTPETTYEDFKRSLLDAAGDSSDLYNEANRILNRSDPVSSALMYFKELSLGAQGLSSKVIRRASALRSSNYESSEDEGEILEDEPSEPQKKAEIAIMASATEASPDGAKEKTIESAAIVDV